MPLPSQDKLKEIATTIAFIEDPVVQQEVTRRMKVHLGKERDFQTWYAGVSEKVGLNPNPDDPKHFYDYRAAWEAGVSGPDESGHWPSKYKKEGHPRMVVEGINTKTGQPESPSEPFISTAQREEDKYKIPTTEGFVPPKAGVAGEELPPQHLPRPKLAPAHLVLGPTHYQEMSTITARPTQTIEQRVEGLGKVFEKLKGFFDEATGINEPTSEEIALRHGGLTTPNALQEQAEIGNRQVQRALVLGFPKTLVSAGGLITKEAFIAAQSNKTAKEVASDVATLYDKVLGYVRKIRGDLTIEEVNKGLGRGEPAAAVWLETQRELRLPKVQSQLSQEYQRWLGKQPTGVLEQDLVRAIKHEPTHILQKYMVKEDVVGILDSLEQGGNKVANSDYIRKWWDDKTYSSFETSRKASEYFSQIFENLTVPESAQHLGPVIDRIGSMSPMEYKGVRLMELGKSRGKRVPFKPGIVQPEAPTQPSLQPLGEFFRETKSLSSGLRSRIAMRSKQTGAVVADATTPTHAMLAEKHSLPMDEAKYEPGWIVDGKFYSSNEDALKALHSIGTVNALTNIRTEPGFFSLAGISNFARNLHDKVTIGALPRLTRVGAQDSAVAAGSAHGAIKPVVRYWIAKIFEGATPQKIEETMKAMVADNILGGHDQFLNMAASASQAGKASIAGHWQTAASRVAQKHGLSNLEAIVNAAKQDPEIMKYLSNWKSTIVPELDGLYNEMRGVDPLSPLYGRGRHFDTRLNLLTKDREAQWLKFNRDIETPMPEPSASNYLNPNVKTDPFAHAAKFTGDYSYDPEAILSSVLGRRWEEVTKFRMYQDLVDKGVAVWGEGIPRPDTLLGRKVATLPVNVPETNPETGITRHVVKAFHVQQDLVGEIRRVVNTDYVEARSKAANLLTNIQLFQFLDAVTHGKNLLSVMSTAQGAGAVWQDVIRQMPVLGTAEGLGRLLSVHQEIVKGSLPILKEMADMAKAGLLRPRFPHSGLQSATKLGDFIYNMDTAARVTMNRFYDNLVTMGKAIGSPTNRRQFINQVGEYNRRLMSPFMRVMKDWGLSPFIVAGRNFNRQARRRLFGSPGVEATSDLAAAKMRLIHLAGVGATFALPAMLNTITTGTPSGRSGTPLGAWDLGLSPDEKGKHKTLDLLQWTGLRRGMRSIGIEAVIEGTRQGHTAEQVGGKALNDILSTAAHPWTGPAVSGVGRLAPIAFPTVGPQVWGSTTSTYVENLRSFAEGQNPLFYSIARPALQATGIDKEPDKPYLRNLANSVFLKGPYQAFGVKDIAPAQSGAEKTAHDIISSHYHSTMDKSDKVRYGAVTAVMNDMRRGEGFSPDTKKVVKDALKSGDLTKEDLTKALKKGTKGLLESYLDRMDAKETTRVFKVGTKEEKQMIAPHLAKKLANADERTQRAVLKELGVGGTQ